MEGLGDSVDVVVLGAYYGKGKRTGVYGGYLLACYDEETESFQSLCKIGTGFSEEALETHYNFFKDHTIPKPKPYYRFHESLACDVWFDTVQVWEIKAADLSLSPKHLAGVGLVRRRVLPAPRHQLSLGSHVAACKCATRPTD